MGEKGHSRRAACRYSMEAGRGEVEATAAVQLLVDIYVPLYEAHTGVVWTEKSLDAVGLAMQGWRGDGFIKNLRGDRLKNYINKPPLARRVDRRTKPPPRYRSAAVVRVARLLVDHGVALRRLLNLAESDAAEELLKPSDVVIAELEMQVAELERKLSKEEASVKRLQDAWRAGDRPPSA